MTPSELLSGLETITQPPATALLAQVGITGPSSSNPSGKGLNILDNGTGMAQLPEMLFKEVGGTGWQGKVTLGDVEEDFLRATREKVEKNGWKGVEVKRLDTMVCLLLLGMVADAAVAVVVEKMTERLMSRTLTCRMIRSPTSCRISFTSS